MPLTVFIAVVFISASVHMTTVHNESTQIMQVHIKDPAYMQDVRTIRHARTQTIQIQQVSIAFAFVSSYVLKTVQNIFSL